MIASVQDIVVWVDAFVAHPTQASRAYSPTSKNTLWVTSGNFLWDHDNKSSYINDGCRSRYHLQHDNFSSLRTYGCTFNFGRFAFSFGTVSSKALRALASVCDENNDSWRNRIASIWCMLLVWRVLVDPLLSQRSVVGRWSSVVLVLLCKQGTMWSIMSNVDKLFPRFLFHFYYKRGQFPGQLFYIHGHYLLPLFRPRTAPRDATASAKHLSFILFHRYDALQGRNPSSRCISLTSMGRCL